MTEAERQEMIEVAGGFITAMLARESRLFDRMEANLGAAESAMAAATAEPFVEGSTGQLTAHPGFKIAAGCDEMALKLYRELTAGQDEVAARMARLMR